MRKLLNDSLSQSNDSSKQCSKLDIVGICLSSIIAAVILALVLFEHKLRLRYSFALAIIGVLCVSVYIVSTMKRNAKVSIPLIFSFLIACMLFGLSYTHLMHLENPNIVKLFENPNIAIHIEATGEKNLDSQGSEVWITSIMDDGKPANLERLQNESWVFRDNKLVCVPTQPIDFVYYSKAKYIEVSLLKHPWSGIVCISNNSNKQTVDLYSATSDTYQISYNYQVEVGIISILSLLSSVLALTGLNLYLLLLFSRHAKLGAYAIGFMISAFLVSCRYISSWDHISKLLIVILGTYVSGALSFLHDGFWKKFVPTRPKTIVFSLIVIYSTFAITYNQIVITPLEINLGISGVCFILAVLFLVTCMSFSILAGMMKLESNFSNRAKATNTSEQKGFMKLWLLLFCIIAAAWSVWLIAYFPANMSPDSISQWYQATGVEPFNNWHPIFHTLLIRFCVTVFNSPAAVAIAQILAGASIWATGGVFLRKHNVSPTVIFIATAILALSPNTGVFSVTLWKDIAFAYAFLAVSICLSKLLVESEASLKRAVFLVISLFCLALFRHNGILPAVGTVIVLAIYYFKSWCRFIPVIAIVLVLFVQNLIYPMLGGSTKTSLNPLALPMLHGIGSVIYYRGELDAQTLHEATDTVPIGVWNAQFNPYLTDPYLYTSDPIKVTDLLSKYDTSQIVKMYMKTFMMNPAIVFHDRLAGADINWSVFTPDKGYVYRYYCGIFIPDSEKFQTPNALTSIMNEYLGISAFQSKVVNAFFWRGGFFVILYLFFGYYLWMRNRQRMSLIILPFALNYLGIFISVPAQDTRYIYMLFFCFPYVLLVSLIDFDRKTVTKI